MSKRVTTWTAAATILSAFLAASTALPAFGGTSTTADKTKTLSFRGMNITVPSEWKVTKDKRWDILHVETKPNCDPEKTGCPSFRIGGPKMIHGSKDPNWIGEVYKPGDYPFHPETSVMPCRFGEQDQVTQVERFPGSFTGKTLASGHRQVGKGHKARYYEWAGECYDEKKRRVTRKFVQREWYLPKEKIVIEDGWDTPGLAGAIKRATWN